MTKKIFIGVCLFLCGSCQQTEQLYSDRELTQVLEKEFGTHSDTVDLTGIDYFKWDQLVILPPYSDVQKVGRELDLNFKIINQNFIKLSDSYNLLVFIKDDKVVKIAELSRNYADFSDEKQIIKKADTRFIPSEDSKLYTLQSSLPKDD